MGKHSRHMLGNRHNYDEPLPRKDETELRDGGIPWLKGAVERARLESIDGVEADGPQTDSTEEPIGTEPPKPTQT